MDRSGSPVACRGYGGLRASMMKRLSLSVSPSDVVSRSSTRRSGARSCPQWIKIRDGPRGDAEQTHQLAESAVRHAHVARFGSSDDHSCLPESLHISIEERAEVCMRGKNGRSSSHSLRPTCCVKTV